MSRRKYIGIGILLIATIFTYFAFQSPPVSPIEDNDLRIEILRELNLEEYEDDESRPNKEDLKELTKLEYSLDKRIGTGMSTLNWTNF